MGSRVTRRTKATLPDSDALANVCQARCVIACACGELSVAACNGRAWFNDAGITACFPEHSQRWRAFPKSLETRPRLHTFSGSSSRRSNCVDVTRRLPMNSVEACESSIWNCLRNSATNLKARIVSLESGATIPPHWPHSSLHHEQHTKSNCDNANEDHRCLLLFSEAEDAAATRPHSQHSANAHRVLDNCLRSLNDVDIVTRCSADVHKRMSACCEFHP